MYRVLGFGLILTALVCLGASEARAQRKKGKEAAQATAQDYAQLNVVKDVTGKLAAAGSTDQTVTLRLDFQQAHPNPDFNPTAANMAVYNQIRRVLADQASVARIQNPIRRQQLMQQLANDLQRLQSQLTGVGKGATNLPYKMTTESKDFELPVDEKVVVRRQNLPYAYDDKGNAIQYSKEEIEKLRGKDRSKPGYEAKLEDLSPGQTVKLFLKADPKAGASSKDSKDPDADLIRKPKVTMIVIIQESSEALGNQQDQKKKKN